MNSSETPSSIEEKWTAFLDGKLAAADAAAFEREHPEAVAERVMHGRLAAAIQAHSPSPELRNAEFFNESILREISPQPVHVPRQEVKLWSLWRLATAGAFCLLAVGAIYFFVVRDPEKRNAPYLAEVISVKAGDAELDATILDADGLAVVWIDGMDNLPLDYALQ
jgi:hypothetical protein